MREHRESYTFQPVPREENLIEYANHILCHFEGATDQYTRYEYALERFLYWRQTNMALDTIAYVRTKNRLLIDKMTKRRNCTFIDVNDFRTTNHNVQS